MGTSQVSWKCNKEGMFQSIRQTSQAYEWCCKEKYAVGFLEGGSLLALGVLGRHHPLVLHMIKWQLWWNANFFHNLDLWASPSGFENGLPRRSAQVIEVPITQRLHRCRTWKALHFTQPPKGRRHVWDMQLCPNWWKELPVKFPHTPGEVDSFGHKNAGLVVGTHVRQHVWGTTERTIR
jgi:hypothetical protein